MNALYAAGMAILAAALVLPRLDVAPRARSIDDRLDPRGRRRVFSAAGWTRATVDLGSWLGFGPAALVADGLSGIFLTIAGLTGAAVSLALLRAAADPPDGKPSLTRPVRGSPPS